MSVVPCTLKWLLNHSEMITQPHVCLQTSSHVCCRFHMTYHAASDEGIFATDMLEARKQREEESCQVQCLPVPTRLKPLPVIQQVICILGKPSCCSSETHSATKCALLVQDRFTTNSCSINLAICSLPTLCGHQHPYPSSLPGTPYRHTCQVWLYHVALNVTVLCWRKYFLSCW